MGLTLMLIKILLFLLIPVFGAAQSETLKLLEKYENAQMLGQHFFNNGVTERLIIYESVDKVLKDKKVKIVRLDIVNYNKGFKQGRQIYTFSHDSLVAYNYRHSIYTLPKRAFHFINFLPGKVYDLFHKTKRIDSLISTKDEEGKIISTTSNNWKEQYTYDANKNLIEISKTFNPYGRDSTSRTFFCAWTAKNWKGVYVDDKLESEVTYWDNGGVINSFHRRENGYLVETSTDSFLKEGNQTTKYHYSKGVIQKKEVISKSGKFSKRKVYKWKI